MQSSGTGGKKERFDVLDSLRFFLAIFVTIAHLGVFPIAGVSPAPGLMYEIARAWNSTVWGMPAVMAFFVISGFCIHYPLHNGREFKPFSFYLRRYTRILIPAAVIVCILAATKPHLAWSGKDSVFFTGTLWSLLCEEIYYALYPLMRLVKQKVGFLPILTVTSTISIVVATRAGGALDWFAIGPIKTAVILYPVWLLGCVLAEQVTERVRSSSSKKIWTYRFAAWMGMWVTETLNFHAHVSQVHTMLFMGVIAYFWIREEIDYGRGRDAIPWMMKAGAWSYSLYLVHPLVFDTFDRLAPAWTAAYKLSWVTQLSVALALAYAFFIVIERPAHSIAKRIGSKRKQLTAAVTEVVESPASIV